MMLWNVGGFSLSICVIAGDFKFQIKEILKIIREQLIYHAMISYCGFLYILVFFSEVMVHASPGASPLMTVMLISSPMWSRFKRPLVPVPLFSRMARPEGLAGPRELMDVQRATRKTWVSFEGLKDLNDIIWNYIHIEVYSL